ncbi:MAG: DsbA family protein [Candidatus Woesearchaeota archaeon]
MTSKTKHENTTHHSTRRVENTNQNNPMMWIAVVQTVLLFVVVLQLGMLEVGTSAPAQQPAPAPQPAPQPGEQQPGQPQEIDMESLLTPTSRIIGDSDAPVTIIEYSDFRCGFCARFHSETYELLKEEYIDTGIVRFVYKDFPVVGGQEAAEAAWCAQEQGQFWEYHDLVFENHQSISNANLKSWAAQLGLDTAQFNECLDSGQYEERVLSEAIVARDLGVQGTPTFIINGEILVGAQPFAAFEQAIAAASN